MIELLFVWSAVLPATGYHPRIYEWKLITETTNCHKIASELSLDPKMYRCVKK